MTDKKVVLITGASNGMGFEAAKLFAKNGWQVVAGARRLEKMNPLKEVGVETMKLDVTDEAANKKFVDFAYKTFGRIDVLINNAGYGETGALEDVSMESAHKQLDTNLFSIGSLNQLVLPIMREQQSGRILNISSIGGDIYAPLGGWYNASKAAMNMYSDVLDLEVKQFGVRSIIIQPGGTESDWSRIAVENGEKNLPENSPYKKLFAGTKNLFNRIETRGSGATSADLAKLFYKAATDANPKRRYFNSFGGHMSVSAARHFPRLFRFTMTRVMNRMAR